MCRGVEWILTPSAVTLNNSPPNSTFEGYLYCWGVVERIILEGGEP